MDLRITYSMVPGSPRVVIPMCHTLQFYPDLFLMLCSPQVQVVPLASAFLYKPAV